MSKFEYHITSSNGLGLQFNSEKEFKKFEHEEFDLYMKYCERGNVPLDRFDGGIMKRKFNEWKNNIT